MEPILITRQKHHRGRSGIRFAWYWHYTVDYGRVIPEIGQRTASFDQLRAARTAAKRNAEPGQAIIERWIGNMPTGGY
jgi:hypothetical protein